jgi:RNA polymerase sigma factor (sigma-70 family)
MTMSAHAVSTAKPRPSVRRLAHRSDDTLRAMAARGDADAFGTLYERHHQSLYRYCRSILGHDEDARDALHNTMAKAWEALRRHEPDVPLRPWLFRIAHNEAISLLRGRRAHAELDETHPISATSIEEALDLRQRLADLEADLAALPERQRSALLLRELCGLGHDDIAAVLVISSATARQTIYEARLALHEAAAGRQMTCAAVQRALSDGDGRTRRRRRIRGHLRTCQACSSFEGVLRQRPAQLAALVPTLPTATSVGLLARLLSHGSAPGAASSTATGTTGGIGALANLASGVATKLAVGSVVVIVGGATELERVAGPTPPTATAAVLPRAGGPAVGGDWWQPSTLEPATGAARGSTHAAAPADRVQPAVPARVTAHESNGPPAGVAGRDDAAGVPGDEVSVERGPDPEPQTATPVTGPVHGASAERPSGLSVTPPGASEGVQPEPRPASPAASPPHGSDGAPPEMRPPSPGADAAAGGSKGALVEPPGRSPGADAGGRASSGVSVEARPSRPAVDPSAQGPNGAKGKQRPASAAPADPPRDASKRLSPEPGSPRAPVDSPGSVGNGGSSEQPPGPSAPQRPKPPGRSQPAPGGDQVAKRSDGTAPVVIGQPASPAPSGAPDQHGR